MNKHIKNKKLSNKVIISGLFVLPFLVAFLFITPDTTSALSLSTDPVIETSGEPTKCEETPLATNITPLVENINETNCTSLDPVTDCDENVQTIIPSEVESSTENNITACEEAPVTDTAPVIIDTPVLTPISTIEVPAPAPVTPAPQRSVVKYTEPAPAEEVRVLPLLTYSYSEPPTETFASVLGAQTTNNAAAKQPYVLWGMIALLGVASIAVLFALFRNKEPEPTERS